MSLLKRNKLTKEEKFTFEIKYREKLPESYHDHKNRDLVEIIDYMIRDIMYFFEEDGELQFLDDYKELIDWVAFFRINRSYSFFESDKAIKLVKIALPYLTKNDLTDTIFSDRHYFSEDDLEEFFREFKDIIDWENIDYELLDFRPKFILEMKDYIDFEYFKQIENIAYTKFAEHMLMYALDHIDEVLSYDRRKASDTNG